MAKAPPFVKGKAPVGKSPMGKAPAGKAPSMPAGKAPMPAFKAGGAVKKSGRGC